MNARLKAWLPYLLLLAAGLVLTAVLQGSEAVFRRRYLGPGRVERTLNLALPWLAAGPSSISGWSTWATPSGPPLPPPWTNGWPRSPATARTAPIARLVTRNMTFGS
jgi:hypothetical protein